MANNWYLSSAGYAAVAQFAISHTYTLGQIIRQLATPTVGQERCFVCTTPGTSGGSESAWSVSQNSTTTQGTAVFTECTGQESYQGTSWAAPCARMITAYQTYAAAGDTVFVGSDHAETQSTSISIGSNGTMASPLRMVCVARPSSAIPPVAADLATTATVSVTGANSISLAGSGSSSTYFYGITFSAGDGSSTGTINLGTSGTVGYQIFDHCTLSVGANTSTSSLIVFGTNNGSMRQGFTLLNTNLKFGATGQSVTLGGCYGFAWRGGAVQGTGPTTLFNGSATGNYGVVEVSNIDLSLIGAAKSLVTQPGSGALTGFCKFNFSNCKLSASLGSVTTGTQDTPEHGDIDLVVSDATTTPREEHYRYAGSVVADTANYLTAGASDGVTHKSWKMASNANASYLIPLYAPDIFQWVPTAGTHSLTIYLSNISSVSLKDTEFGFDVAYMGASTSPLGTFTSSFAPLISGGTALTTDTQPWTGQGGLTKQRVSLTVTVNQAGWIRLRPRLSRASFTVWVDPLVVVS